MFWSPMSMSSSGFTYTENYTICQRAYKLFTLFKLIRVGSIFNRAWHHLTYFFVEYFNNFLYTTYYIFNSCQLKKKKKRIINLKNTNLRIKRTWWAPVQCTIWNPDISGIVYTSVLYAIITVFLIITYGIVKRNLD